MQNRNLYTLTIGLLGAIKLTLESFGIHVITDEQINSIADGVAAVFAVAGVIMSHNKANKSNQTPTPNTPAQ